MKQFVNRVTREVFLYVYLDWEDPVAIAREWLEMCGDSAAEQLANQLKKDIWEEYAECDDELSKVFAQTSLRRVSWEQVASRLLERAAVESKKESGEEREGPQAEGKS